MKALSYLLVKQIKNRILSLKKKPGMLILYGFILVVVIFSIVMLILSGEEMNRTEFADERILFLILSALGLFFVWMFVNTGLSTGSSLFTMPDVGLLFVAPISPKKILMYGLLSTMGKSLMGSLFIFYQIGNLKANFDYGFIEIFSLFIIFAILILFCQLISIGIYIFSNGNSDRKRLVRLILYTFFVALVAVVLLLQRREQIGIFEAVLQMVETKWFGYIPIAGWATMFFIGVVHGSFTMVLTPLFFFLSFSIIIILLLTAGKADYYEDVLQSTEVTFQTKAAAKEGRSLPKNNAKKIKVSDKETGINRGSGAITIFYKHMLEMKRKSRFVFLDGYTIFAATAMGVSAYYFHKYNAPEFMVYIALGTAVYIQFILSMMGKLQWEIIKPYIYLIPAKSLYKVLAASLTNLIKPCFDGVCMFTVFAVMGGADVLTCFFCAIAYAASGAVFTALTILFQRVLGGQPNKIVQVFFVLGLIVVVMAPAIGASVVAAILLPSALQFLCTLPYTIFCLLFTTVMFVSCGNLIDKAEFTGRV